MCIVMTVLSANAITFAAEAEEASTTQSSATVEFSTEEGMPTKNVLARGDQEIFKLGSTNKVSEIGAKDWNLSSVVTLFSAEGYGGWNNGEAYAGVFLHPASASSIGAYYQYATDVKAIPEKAELYYTRCGQESKVNDTYYWKYDYFEVIYGVSPTVKTSGDGASEEVYETNIYLLGFNIVKDATGQYYQLGYRYRTRKVTETVSGGEVITVTTDGREDKTDIEACDVPGLPSETEVSKLTKLLKVNLAFENGQESSTTELNVTISGKYAVGEENKEFTVPLKKALEANVQPAVGIYAHASGYVTSSKGAFANPVVTYKCLEHQYDNTCDTTCNVCGAVNTAADAGHKMTHVAAKAPTSKEKGNIEYWECTKCKKYYSDARGTQEIVIEDTVLPVVTAKAEAERTYQVGELADSNNLPGGVGHYTTTGTTTVYNESSDVLTLNKQAKYSYDVNMFVAEKDSYVVPTSIKGSAQTGSYRRPGLNFVYKSKKTDGATTYSCICVSLYASSSDGLQITYYPSWIDVTEQNVTSRYNKWDYEAQLKPADIVNETGFKKYDGSALTDAEKANVQSELGALTTTDALNTATNDRWIEYEVYEVNNKVYLKFAFTCKDKKYIYEREIGTGETGRITEGEELTLGVGLKNSRFDNKNDTEEAQNICLKDFTVGYEVSEEYAPQINGATFRKSISGDESQTVAYQCTVPYILDGKKISEKGMLMSLDAYVKNGNVTKEDLVENVASDSTYIKRASKIWKSSDQYGFIANVGGVKNDYNGRRYIVRVYVKYADGLVIYSHNTRESQGITDGYATNSVISIAKYYLRFCWSHYRDYSELSGITDVISKIAEDGTFTYTDRYNPKTQNDNGGQIVYGWFKDNENNISSVLNQFSKGNN